MIAQLGNDELSVSSFDYKEFPQPKIDISLDLYEKILERIKKDQDQSNKIFKVYKPFVLENVGTYIQEDDYIEKPFEYLESLDHKQ